MVPLKTAMPCSGKLKTKRTDIQPDHYKMPRNITITGA